MSMEKPVLLEFFFVEDIDFATDWLGILRGGGSNYECFNDGTLKDIHNKKWMQTLNGGMSHNLIYTVN